MIHYNALMSIFKFSRDFIDELAGEGVATPTFMFWDAHSEVHELPSVDLLGPGGFTISVDDRIHTVTCAIGSCPFEDTNLFRHSKIMSLLYERLQPGEQIQLIDYNTGLPLSWMVIINGTEVMPVTRAETRTYQFIQFSALLNPAGVSA